MLIAIYAVSADGYIAHLDGSLPARSPSDLKNFKTITEGHTVVMGRETWESLPKSFRPLPNRRNVVLTSNRNLDTPGAMKVHSIEEIIALSHRSNKIFVIGGAKTLAALAFDLDSAYISTFDVVLGEGISLPDELHSRVKSSTYTEFRLANCDDQPWRQHLVVF